MNPPDQTFPNLRKLALLACSVGLTITAGAQTPAETAATTAQPPAAAVVPPDPKLLKQWETLSTQKFVRDANDIFYGLERNGVADPATLSPVDRFLSFFRLGEWNKLGADLRAMPLELSRKIYGKVLNDLTEKQKPNVRLEDVLGLADAAPAKFNGEELRKLGQLLAIVVPPNENYWLAASLQKGTGTLGGSDPARRLAAARVLLAGNFKDLARVYLPTDPEIERIEDEGLRNELKQFRGAQQESEATQRGQAQRVWDENIRTITLASTNDWERTKAAQALSRVISQIAPGSLAPGVHEMIKTRPDGAVRLLSHLGRKFQNEARGDVAVRNENLKVQATLASLLAEAADLQSAPWNQLSQLMANFWIQEADNTFVQRAGTAQDKFKYLAPEDLLPSAPSGKWLESLPVAVRDRLDVSLSKTILGTSNFEQAAEKIIAIGKRNPGAGVALAEEFIGIWAAAHSPQIPELLRKKYDLPEGSRIPVTPIMMEKNIQSLAAMMALFRASGMTPKDYDKLVSAFDLAYSSAEAYRSSHIEKVFGRFEDMDESLFFLIINKMNVNLGERWRRMDVQKAGVTRRDESQTLNMVREGYASALEMIEKWLSTHPSGARALTLGGTLLCDWGDFEYFQELVSGEPRKRMLVYKEKNIQAQDFFIRATEVYAKEVAKLSPSSYSVDAYLGWFHGLLGIGSGGQLNLSKAINRSSLAKIREQMLALPEKASTAHLNQFAKVINTRLLDEKEPLHENLKYRYLASALVITKDDPFTLAAEKRVAYLDQLLSEIRLQTRIDGANTVPRDHEFGIIVSVMHTEAMGRVAQFGQYLSNDPNAGLGRSKKKSTLARKMRDGQGPRDELELNLTEALSPFFEIKSMTFSSPDAKARATAQAGWEETVLAYILVRARDSSVDKVPPVSLELKFMDLSGPVTVPAESAETLIKVAAENAPPRPLSKLEITQTLDTRQLLINGSLLLEVKATATGLVPELEQLVDLDGLKRALNVKAINAHEGLQIKELNTWGDNVTARSERLWTVFLDGNPIRAAKEQRDFQFPALKAKEASPVYQSYNDVDLITLPQGSLKIGRAHSGDAAEQKASESLLPKFLFAGVLLAAGGALTFGLRKKTAGLAPKAGLHPEFKMPADLDGFAAVSLLERIRRNASARFEKKQQEDLQQDLTRIQQACFGAGTGGMPEAELRGIVQKWLTAGV